MLRIGWLATLVLAGCAARPAFALDPEKAITQFVHTAWTEKDGAPSGIRVLAQTTDGYLWLGTNGGLFHFDGVRFAAFKSQAGEELPATRIRTMLATRDGALWIVFRPGTVSRLLNGHLTSYSEKEGLPATFSLAEDKEGKVIAGTAKGLSRFEGGVWKDVGKEWAFPGSRAEEVFVDKSGAIWAITEDRAVYLPAGSSRFVDPREIYGAGGLLAQAPDGAIWLADLGRSAHTVRQSGDHAPITEVRVGASDVLFDRNGSLWIGTAGDGLRRVAHPDQIKGRAIAHFGPEAEQFTAKNGLSGDIVSRLLEDREGNIWSATGHGLDRFRETTFIQVKTPEPDSHRAVLAGKDGSLWSYSVNAAVVRIQPRGNLETIAQLSAESMCECESGHLWTVGQRRFNQFQRGRFSDVALPAGPVFNALVAITCDNAGGIWLFDTHEGLFHLVNGAFTKIGVQPDGIVAWGSLYADRRNRIWLGQYSRVTLYDHGKLQDFGTNEGVPPGMVLTFHEDRAGNVWASGDGGLSKFDNGSFRSVSTRGGFPARSVFGLTEDDLGYWWLVTDVGVLRIPAGDLDRALSDSSYRIRFETLNPLDDLTAKPHQGAAIPIATTTDGRIWFATTSGLAYVDPRRMPKNNLPPPVHIERVKVDGKDVLPGAGMPLPHRTKDLEIDYTALSLTIPERVLFRYKLEGKDTDWYDAGSRRQAYYGALPPRKYTFRVIACNNDGVWNEAGAAWTFSVTPAFYQTWWFDALCVMAGSLLLAGAYQLRIRQIAAALNARFDERLAERTRLAREFHDTLLQTIQGSKMVADDALKHNSDATKMQHAMERLSEWLGQAIEEGRAALGSLRSSTTERNDIAEALRRAGEECQFQRPIKFVLTVHGAPREMHPIVRDEVYRIGYEAIRNACVHSEGSRLNVELGYLDDLVLRVCDNGKRDRSRTGRKRKR
jgi:signal transduction histidine kinase/ligand-binding sensor domain-containing protein